MKSLTKVFVALVLAVTIAFGGFSGNAHAQSPVGANVNVAIDVNTTIDQILGLISSTQKFQMVIVNQTGSPLIRAGAYNYLSNWVIGDVPPLTATYRDWTERGYPYFNYASNYQLGSTGKYFQFGASWPPVGKRKINLCARNESGNMAARPCYDAMSDANEKNLVNGQFTARAIMVNNSSVQWIYQVK